MASFAKESLSPLLKSANIRRRSFDLCQKLGNHLLSPNTSPLFPPTSPSQTNNGSPGENPCSSPFKLSPLSPVFNFSYDSETCDASAATKTTSYHYKRRASDSLWIDTLPVETALRDGKQGQKRRRSLTVQQSPHTLLPSPKSNAKNRWDHVRLEKQQVERPEIQKTEITCKIIPPTPQKRMQIRPLKYQLGHARVGYRGNGSDDENEEPASDPNGSCIHIPHLRRDTGSWSLKSPEGMNPARSSAGGKYDLDDSLVKALSLKWNLSLNADELLGKGSFGVVVGGTYQGKPVAVKVLKIINAPRKASVLGEDNALNLPPHNHIAKIMDILSVGPDRTLIIMEKMERGNLFKLLNDSSFEMDCSLAIKISKQIALALVFCHREGLLHLDVKPQNILVDRSGCCKLSDFGNSKKVANIDSGQKYSTLEGTVPYTAPELFKGSKPAEKCDVYSFGITMWQILTREMPYENVNEHIVIFRVVSQGLRPSTVKNQTDFNGNDVITEESQLTLKFQEIYERAWNAVPELRPSMTDIHKNLIEIQLL